MTWVLDSKALGERDGFDIRVDVTYDQDAQPADYDCYDQATIKAWDNSEWEFVLLRVVASKRGHELGDAYLGGVERGWFPREGERNQFIDPLDEGSINDYTDDMVEEALLQAKAELAALVA
ncbi:hypothetical protein FREDWARD_84 [Mycobacterium phage Fredward]|uniref:hypothetical protein n=1 Tax=Mycobacterium phage Fredward TaxID=1354510 RepID=UPI0003BA1ACB|nr:hypothetical protein V424_gp029 [Mycobacterium phage Fredward]AGY37026.1 hypothetical protein FREDWARD_84 [Mycobacterium phage Fredward]